MALSIVEDACRSDGEKLIIVVQGSNPGELMTSTAKAMA
jgi:hypothetical protein